MNILIRKEYCTEALIDLSPCIKQPEMFPTAVYNRILLWKEMFGDEPYNIIHDVCIS